MTRATSRRSRSGSSPTTRLLPLLQRAVLPLERHHAGEPQPDARPRAGADGLKTGHTEEAGFGLTASAIAAGGGLILVVNGLSSMRARAEESERLLEWGFREFDNAVIFRAHDTVEEVPVYLGSRPTVPLVSGHDLVLTLPRQWRRTLQVRLRYEAPIPAPITKGQEIGRLFVSGQGVPEMELPLIAGADVERLGLFPRIPAVIGRWFGA
jgi:D-alanyl-D-alanine carboxypeptidase (penicillin-binding protein 5/6)